MTKNSFVKNTDGFFANLENTKPYFKAALEGFAGSGKTYTASLIAKGLYRLIKSKKPIVLFDTERAVKFLKPLFEEAKIPVLVKESRSMADLKETMERCRQGDTDILVIDSISHVWENFLEAYKQKVKRTNLQFQDWGIIKPTWKKEFSDVFVNDPYHIIMCGRAGYEYSFEKDEDTGRRELLKTGVKMKVEGETAYEPDLLVLMERYEKVLGKKKKVWREATVIKDRANLIDGKTFVNPVFENFKPTIDMMLSNPVKIQTPAERDSTVLFKTEEDKREWKKRKDKALEEIQGYMVSIWPGQSAADKKAKVDVLEEAFKTRSWTAIEDMSSEVLETGYKKIQEIVKKQIKGDKKK